MEILIAAGVIKKTKQVSIDYQWMVFLKLRIISVIFVLCVMLSNTLLSTHSPKFDSLKTSKE